jgi:hypothetical protein
VALQQKQGYTKTELHKLARANGVETHKQVDKILPGWEGKSKGQLQALWERGLLNPQLLDKYTLEGKKIQYQGRATYKICYVTSLPNALISRRMKKLYYSIWDHSLVSRYVLLQNSTPN